MFCNDSPFCMTHSTSRRNLQTGSDPWRQCCTSPSACIEEPQNDTRWHSACLQTGCVGLCQSFWSGWFQDSISDFNNDKSLADMRTNIHSPEEPAGSEETKFVAADHLRHTVSSIWYLSCRKTFLLGVNWSSHSFFPQNHACSPYLSCGNTWSYTSPFPLLSYCAHISWSDLFPTFFLPASLCFVIISPKVLL